MGGTEKLVFFRYESTWTPPDIVVNLDKVGAYDMIGKLQTCFSKSKWYKFYVLDCFGVLEDPDRVTIRAD